MIGDKKKMNNNQSSSNSSSTPNNSTDTTPAIDEVSIQGKFGWVTMGKTHIPYIIRNEENTAL